jgi:hypothetical protein
MQAVRSIRASCLFTCMRSSSSRKPHFYCQTTCIAALVTYSDGHICCFSHTIYTAFKEPTAADNANDSKACTSQELENEVSTDYYVDSLSFTVRTCWRKRHSVSALHVDCAVTVLVTLHCNDAVLCLHSAMLRMSSFVHISKYYMLTALALASIITVPPVSYRITSLLTADNTGHYTRSAAGNTKCRGSSYGYGDPKS